MPFIGGAFIPNDRLFAQWMVQCDIDANGNPVIATDTTTAKKNRYAARLHFAVHGPERWLLAV